MAETKSEQQKAQEISSHGEEEPQQMKVTEEDNADAAGDPTEEVKESEFIQAYNKLKIFLNGTEDSHLKDNFSSNGTVVDATIKKDNHTGKSVKTVLAKEHKINGGKGEIRHIEVEGILESTKDDVVKTYFKKFGKIYDFCRPWYESMRHCYISLEMEASPEEFFCQKHKIGGQEVVVKDACTNHSSQRSGNERNRDFGGPRYHDRRTYRNESKYGGHGRYQQHHNQGGNQNHSTQGRYNERGVTQSGRSQHYEDQGYDQDFRIFQGHGNRGGSTYDQGYDQRNHGYRMGRFRGNFRVGFGKMLRGRGNHQNSNWPY